jgi:hypothetical protein
MEEDRDTARMSAVIPPPIERRSPYPMLFITLEMDVFPPILSPVPQDHHGHHHHHGNHVGRHSRQV